MACFCHVLSSFLKKNQIIEGSSIFFFFFFGHALGGEQNARWERTVALLYIEIEIMPQWLISKLSEAAYKHIKICPAMLSDLWLP